MPRWLAHLLIVFGWLISPLLAWGASYIGLWAGALAAVGFQRPLTMLAIAVAVAVVSGLAAIAGWVWFMRRLPHLLSHHMAPRASTGEHRAVAAAE